MPQQTHAHITDLFIHSSLFKISHLIFFSSDFVSFHSTFFVSILFQFIECMKTRSEEQYKVSLVILNLTWEQQNWETGGFRYPEKNYSH